MIDILGESEVIPPGWPAPPREPVPGPIPPGRPAPPAEPVPRGKRTLNIVEATARLKVSRRTVYSMIRDGRLHVERAPVGQRVLATSPAFLR